MYQVIEIIFLSAKIVPYLTSENSFKFLFRPPNVRRPQLSSHNLSLKKKKKKDLTITCETLSMTARSLKKIRDTNPEFPSNVKKEKEY